MRLKPRLCFSAMLLVTLAYIVFVLLGHMPTSHAAAETQHLPNYSRLASPFDSEAQSFSAGPSDHCGAPGRVIAPPRLDPPTRSFVQAPWLQDVTVLAHWVELGLAGLNRPSGHQVLPWPAAPELGSLLYRWHRSVVLHL